jgi:hypothetical protein
MYFRKWLEVSSHGNGSSDQPQRKTQIHSKEEVVVNWEYRGK